MRCAVHVLLVAAACTPAVSPLSFVTSHLALLPSAGLGHSPGDRNAALLRTFPRHWGCAQHFVSPCVVQMRIEGMPGAASSPLLARFPTVIGLLGSIYVSLSLPLGMAPPSVWAAQLPDTEYARLAEVRGLLQDEKYAAAEETLTRSLELWQKSDQPPLEIATILKDRAIARQLSNQQGALADLDAALKLYAQMDAAERPIDDVVGATFLRGQVHLRLSQLEAAEKDFSAALDSDEENPFLWSARGDTRLRRADWAGAAQDFLAAEKQFKLIGDKIRRTLAAADASVAMLGSGEKLAALEKMALVSRQARFDVASNDPEDIPRLREIARKEAELHLVRAGVAWKDGKPAEAAGDWARGCIRLEGYAMDGANRKVLRASKEDDAARRAMTGPSSQDAAEDALASLLGMDPNSKYVKDRESDKPLWNQFVPGKSTDFDPKAALPDRLDQFVGCRSFYDAAWVQKNRLWPPEVQEGVKKFVREYDFSTISDIKTTRQFKVSWDEMSGDL